MANALEKILSQLGGQDKATKTLKEGIKNKKWIQANFEKLKENYLKKFIAVLDQKVIVAIEDLKELLKYLNEKYPDNNEIAIEYIGPEEKLSYFL